MIYSDIHRDYGDESVKQSTLLLEANN